MVCNAGWAAFHENDTEITKTKKAMKTIQTATSKELSAGSAEFTETTQIQSTNHGFPKQ